ncbi:hypothetical protein ColLi_08447 [Colletotrichum liriopes]|uniref:Uncharacterized protein n=1 Tax=Colletotrichum liriopes TaxID=708192 RepID=A0AA37GRQ7_9PEZI|nr:hypothetical protein ColLi_08447 [Colletotrichum liriopes]
MTLAVMFNVDDDELTVSSGGEVADPVPKIVDTNTVPSRLIMVVTFGNGSGTTVCESETTDEDVAEDIGELVAENGASDAFQVIVDIAEEGIGKLVGRLLDAVTVAVPLFENGVGRVEPVPMVNGRVLSLDPRAVDEFGTGNGRLFEDNENVSLPLRPLGNVVAVPTIVTIVLDAAITRVDWNIDVLKLVNVGGVPVVPVSV